MNSANKKSGLQDDDKFMVRFEPGMRAELERTADQNDRSLNKEVVRRLRQSRAIPEDVAAACAEMGDVKDLMDLVGRICKRSGLKLVPVDE